MCPGHDHHDGCQVRESGIKLRAVRYHPCSQLRCWPLHPLRCWPPHHHAHCPSIPPFCLHPYLFLLQVSFTDQPPSFLLHSAPFGSPRILSDYSTLPLPSPCPHVQTSICLYLHSRLHSLPRLPLCPFTPPPLHALGLLETLSLSFPARGNSCLSFLPVSFATICFRSSLCRYTNIAMATRRWRAPSKVACSGTGAKTCRTCPSLCSMSR